MPHAIEKFAELDTPSLITELGGFLFTPSVLIKCLGSFSFERDIIQSLVLRASDFFLNVYMSEIDKNIVEDNFRGGIVGGYIDDETFSLISRMLNSITSLPFNREIEFQAHENSSDRISLYDSRRLEAAFQHGVSLVTCDPLHFTNCPVEREHIRKFGYTDVLTGKSDSDGGIVDAKVWVFSPKALALLLRNSDSQKLEGTDKSELLALVNYQVTSSINQSTAEVELTFNGENITGKATSSGTIDVLFEAVKQAVAPYVRPHIELSKSSLHMEISDTTANNDLIQVHLQLYINEHQFDAAAEGLNALTCALHAYLQTINAALKLLF